MHMHTYFQTFKPECFHSPFATYEWHWDNSPKTSNSPPPTHTYTIIYNHTLVFIILNSHKCTRNRDRNTYPHNTIHTYPAQWGQDLVSRCHWVILGNLLPLSPDVCWERFVALFGHHQVPLPGSHVNNTSQSSQDLELCRRRPDGQSQNSCS